MDNARQAVHDDAIESAGFFREDAGMDGAKQVTHGREEALSQHEELTLCGK